MINKRVLVLGAGGMAGHVIATYLNEQGYDVTTVSARNKLDDETLLLDVTSQSEFEKFLDNGSYDIIINAIGILVQMSEDRKDLSTYLNSYLPHYLEQRFKDQSTKIIHLSTDCVFSGKNAPYSEESPYDGELFYDRTKALGEIINDKDLTFRMSIIGPDMQESGIGLFNWFYKQTGEIGGYSKAIWNGITTIELAKAIHKAISKDIHGLYNLVPKGNISKYELLKLFKNSFKRDDITIKENPAVSLDKTLLNTRTDFDFSIPEYPAMIDEMHDWVKKHKSLYPHYDKS